METTEHTAENETFTLLENNKSAHFFLSLFKDTFQVQRRCFCVRFPSPNIASLTESTSVIWKRYGEIWNAYNVSVIETQKKI
jgi:hypothetical protein